jgi:mannobiose 2-epimerase
MRHEPDTPDLREHLLTRVLPFWARHSVDRDHGGFITHLGRDGKVTDSSHKFLVMQARMIYSFATGAALGGPAEWLSMARQGVEFFLRHFRDIQYDGWFWSVTRQGRPAESGKRMYGHAFAIYALSEYARHTGDAHVLAAANHTWSLAAEYLWDREHEGVVEVSDRAWAPTDRSHTMGTHLHTLEALLALNDAIGDNRYLPHARKIADLIATRMANYDHREGSGACQPEAGRRRRKCGIECFLPDWTPDADRNKGLVNYGHNLEAAWLLLRMYRLEGTPRYRDTAGDFLEYVMEYGLDTAHGGVFSHGPLGEAATVREKIWWVQCEALPAFLLGHLVFGEARYLDAFRSVARFCLDHLHDPEHGEWYHSTEENGRPRDVTKGSAWKAAYHITQAIAYADEYLKQIA